MPAAPPDLHDVEAAAERLQGVAHETPVLTSPVVDELLGARLFFKAESLQRTGSFKLRGAYNRVSTLDPEQLAGGLVASSAGNHAQALALAAKLCGSRATILMPQDAPASKRAATEAHGAEVISFDRQHDDREAMTRELAETRGLTVVHPYDDPWIVAGAGTAARELLLDVGELDLLLVPTGGGGLLAGSATAARAMQPDVRVVGVEPETSDDWQRSFAAGERVEVTVRPGIADGQQLSIPGELNFTIAQRLVEGIATVTDGEIAAAMRLIFEALHIVVEPSGATAFAAVAAGRVDVRGLRVGIMLSGGNVDTTRFAEIMAVQGAGADAAGSSPATNSQRNG